MTSLQFQLTTDPNATTPTFTLTCNSTGGPVTTFSWRRDGALVTNNNSYNIAAPVVTDAVSGTYSLTLTVMGRRAGQYECSVTNSRTPMDTGNLTIESKFYEIVWAHCYIVLFRESLFVARTTDFNGKSKWGVWWCT